MKQFIHLKTIVLTTLLTIAALVAGQQAWATSTFTVTTVKNPDGTCFIIKRSSSGTTETVYYRTVSLSARANKNFKNVYGKLTFSNDELSKSIDVEEYTVLGRGDWTY